MGMAPSAFPLPGRTVRLPVALPPHRRREEAAGGAQEAEEVRDEPKRVVSDWACRGARREGRACRVRSPPDFTTEHTERPTAVTEYTKALGMQGHGGGGPRSSVSSVCRKAASVCSVAKKVAKVLQ